MQRHTPANFVGHGSVVMATLIQEQQIAHWDLKAEGQSIADPFSSYDDRHARDLRQRRTAARGRVEGPFGDDRYLQGAGRRNHSGPPPQSGWRPAGGPVRPWRAGQGGLRLSVRALSVLARRVSGP